MTKGHPIRVDTKVDFLSFAKYEIKIYLAKFRNKNFANFRNKNFANFSKILQRNFVESILGQIIGITFAKF
jgi:hypothetical protein